MSDGSHRAGAEALAREYAEALRDYVSGGGEAALTRAYELGRRAAKVGLLDLALVHHDALAALPPAAGGAAAPLGMAAQFLAEALSPFEMTLRSYQANARLLGLGESLERRNAEIDRSREQLRTILDATTAVIYLKDADGRFLFANRRFEQVFGVRRDDVVGKLDEEVLPAAAARWLRDDDLQALAARAPREVEEVFPAADGEHTYLALKVPLVDAAGAAYGVCCVASDITERKRADEARLAAQSAAERQRQLERAIEQRDQFLAIATHELKTPLTALELQVAWLRRLARSHPEALVSDGKVQAKCEVMVKQVERLNALINDLVHAGRVASEVVAPVRERVDLVEVARRVLARAEETIARSRSAVALRASGPVMGEWDPRQLETAVAALVSNAVKFGTGNAIEIDVQAQGGKAILVVRDHGIGISPDDRDRIFGRFERAVSERHYGGFGIGLWLARRAVEAHGGRVFTTAPEEGGGSSFTIELPLG